MIEEQIQAYRDNVIKKLGTGSLITATEVREKPRWLVPVGPSLDIDLNGGVPSGSWAVISGITKAGKAQPLDSMVYTDSGPVRMGDLRIGDFVCSPEGGFTEITDIFDHESKDIYNISFNDGTEVQCCNEHLWKVRGKGGEYKVLSVDQIIQKTQNNSQWKYPKVPICDFVEFDRQTTTILNPYLLGLLLGDGCFKNGRYISFTTVDDFLLKEFTEICQGYGWECKPTSQKDPDCISYRINKNGADKGIIDYIKGLNLFNLSSKEKFIPQQYLYSDVSVRLDLLRGLLDTDGSVSCHGTSNAIEYCSTSKQLAEDVVFLSRSLGCKSSIVKRYTSYDGIKKFPSYRVSISHRDGATLFNLPRKIELCKKKKYSLHKNIIDIQYVGKKPARCIELDPESDHLYITDGMTVTHNTTTALQIAKNAQELYGCPIVFVNVEGRFKGQAIGSVAGLDPDNIMVIESTEEKILSGEDFLWSVEEAIRNIPGCVIIIDSISRLYAKTAMEAEVSGDKRSTTPKLMADFCDRLCTLVPVTNCIVLCIAQVYANSAPQGANARKSVVGGGNAVKYQSDILMNVQYAPDWTEGSGDKSKTVGKELQWDVINCAIGQPPEGKTLSYIRFGHGIDEVKELIVLGMELGVLNVSKSWIEYHGVKKNGQAQFYAHLIENPEELASLKAEIREISVDRELIKYYEGNRPQWEGTKPKAKKQKKPKSVKAS